MEFYKEYKGIVAILMILLVGIVVIGLGSLIFWGIGNLIIWVFKINYVWTIWHGLVTMLIYMVLKEIFTGRSKD